MVEEKKWMSIDFSIFKPIGVVIAKPELNEDKKKIIEYPHLKFFDDENDVSFLGFDSYDEIEKIGRQILKEIEKVKKRKEKLLKEVVE